MLRIFARFFLAALWAAATFLQFYWRVAEHYRPERHYMRGPGPKSLRKQAELNA